MTPPETGPLAVASLLLAAGGMAKLVRPDTTSNALRAAGWRLGPGAVRAGAAAEVATAAVALSAGGPVAAGLVSASYLLLAGFVTFALVSGTPLATCACFGEADTPPTVLHALVNGSLSIGAALAAVSGNASGREWRPTSCSSC
jgi:hypothetical protein